MTRPPTLAVPKKKAAIAAPAPWLELVGARIKLVREAKGLTRDGLAHNVPVDRAYLYRLEMGQAAPTVTTLFKLALALECEVSELLPPLSDIRAVLEAHGQTM